MKIILILLLWVCTQFVFGQSIYRSSIIYPQDLPQWEYKDFIKYNVKKVSAFSYYEKDSILFYQKEFDKINNRIFGINSRQNQGQKWEFDSYYDKNGNILKEFRFVTVFKDIISIQIPIHEHFYEYSQNLLIKKNITTHSFMFEVKTYMKSNYIQEFTYNSKGSELYQYETSSAVIYTEGKLVKDSTNKRKKYLLSERIYDKNNLLNIQSSYFVGKLMSKTYSFYDKKHRIIKLIDSTWNFDKEKLDISEYSEFEYSDSGKTEKKENFELMAYKATLYYDKSNRLVKNCIKNMYDPFFCNHIIYFQENGLTVKIIFKSRYPEEKTLFFYNSKGLLTEEKIYENDKLKSAVKYFYEYY